MQNMDGKNQQWSAEETSCLLNLWSLVETQNKPKAAMCTYRHVLNSLEKKKKKSTLFSELMAQLSH